MLAKDQGLQVGRELQVKGLIEVGTKTQGPQTRPPANKARTKFATRRNAMNTQNDPSEGLSRRVPKDRFLGERNPALEIWMFGGVVVWSRSLFMTVRCFAWDRPRFFAEWVLAITEAFENNPLVAGNLQDKPLYLLLLSDVTQRTKQKETNERSVTLPNQTSGHVSTGCNNPVVPAVNGYSYKRQTHAWRLLRFGIFFCGLGKEAVRN